MLGELTNLENSAAPEITPNSFGLRRGRSIRMPQRVDERDRERQHGDRQQRSQNPADDRARGDAEQDGQRVDVDGLTHHQRLEEVPLRLHDEDHRAQHDQRLQLLLLQFYQEYKELEHECLYQYR